MRLLIFTLVVLLGSSVSHAQKIKKDRQSAIAEIKNNGRSVYPLNDDSNSFYYKRYDEEGDATVLYVCENDQVRKVLFICQDPTQVPKRSLQAFKTVNSGYEVDPIIKGVFKGTNSCYYEGKARYEGVNNYQDKKFYLEIVLLD
ncbi:hypothetical protein SAMN05421788_106236 [Filimonas lacunae]|uniref:Uncharacterized protein n=1 Tax=Filimonas lacunae TaxID=477680 RepID=A0A1N7QRF5_9BACT|nr:hypothetical protein [Filimonas lacunae]SIT25077.1 hypothetical protein SAMN05421788_106236 [Filimonas lacunae]